MNIKTQAALCMKRSLSPCYQQTYMLLGYFKHTRLFSRVYVCLMFLYNFTLYVFVVQTYKTMLSMSTCTGALNEVSPCDSLMRATY